MLILAGVSLNAIVGDNGIITNAQNASIKSGMAALEEYLQQTYIKYYEEFDSDTSPLDILIAKKKNWFYTKNGGFIVDSQGHRLYLLVKSELQKDEPALDIKGGNAIDGSYKNYATLQDVYGVTSDLKVYYCSSGLSSIDGAELNDIETINGSTPILSTNDPLTKIIDPDDEDGITLYEIKKVTKLTLDDNSGLSSLDSLYKLSSLSELTIKNWDSTKSLSGLEYCYTITYLCFYNCNFSSYSSISSLVNLNYLYLYKSNDNEVSGVFNSMKNTDYNNLKYLGVFGATVNMGTWPWFTSGCSSREITDVTNVSTIANLTPNTKKACEYLYLNNNQISVCPDLSGFSNVKHCFLNQNNLTNLNGVANLSGCRYIIAHYNENLSDISGISNLKNLDGFTCYETSITNVNALENLSELRYLYINKNELLEDVSGCAKLLKLINFHLAGCPSLLPTTVTKMAKAYNRVGATTKSIDDEYLEFLITNDTKIFSTGSLTDSELATQLLNSTEIVNLKLDNNTNLANTSFSSLSSEVQTAILNRLGNSETSKTNDAYFRYILSTMTNMECLTLRGLNNLSNVDFIKYMPNLIELNLRGTSITDLTVLETLVTNGTLSNFALLALDNGNTDMTKIQKTITFISKNTEASPQAKNSNIKTEYYGITGTWTNYNGEASYGLYIYNNDLLTKDYTSLKCCNLIERLTMIGVPTNSTKEFDLSGCSSLKHIHLKFVRQAIKLPTAIEEVIVHQSQAPIFDGSASVPTQLKSLCINNCGGINQAGMDAMFDSLKYCQTTNGITYIYTTNTDVREPITGISNMKNCKFDEVWIRPYWETIKTLDDLNNFNGTGYISWLYIDGRRAATDNPTSIEDGLDLTNLKANKIELNKLSIKSLSFIGDNTYVKEILLDDNEIQDLKPIENMTQLEYLSLKRNIVENIIYVDEENIIDNINILKNLCKYYNSANNLKKVSLTDNLFYDSEEYITLKSLFTDESEW